MLPVNRRGEILVRLWSLSHRRRHPDKIVVYVSWDRRRRRKGRIRIRALNGLVVLLR